MGEDVKGDDDERDGNETCSGGEEVEGEEIGHRAQVADRRQVAHDPVDDEGLDTTEKCLIKNGILTEYLNHREIIFGKLFVFHFNVSVPQYKLFKRLRAFRRARLMDEELLLKIVSL